jgi:hypothetical protein
VLGGERDQRTGRDGAPVDVGDGRHARAEQSVADLHRGIHAPAERVHLQHYGGRVGARRFVEYALHERREP